jgi:hypothetical protein
MAAQVIASLGVKRVHASKHEADAKKHGLKRGVDSWCLGSGVGYSRGFSRCHREKVERQFHRLRNKKWGVKEKRGHRCRGNRGQGKQG